MRLRAFGPAIIVAAVVLGPGSVLTASRVGCDHAYGLVWVLVLAALLMAGTTALSARLGATLEGTLCDEVARRAGRPLAALVGVVLFLVVACFQFSNNVAVVASVEPLLGESGGWAVSAIVAVNVVCALALLGFRRLYRPLEVGMKALVLLMALGFVGNLVLARPSLAGAAAGLVPRLPDGPLLPVLGLVGTTFSIAGAFYQSYLVRRKGWTEGDLGRGSRDALAGIAVLGALSLTVMLTAAAVLHGRVEGARLQSAADVARQLEPLFGSGAKWLFCAGLFAGAFSSFLVNALIGGTVLADGLGLGGDMDGRWPKAFTLLALAGGMVVAVAVEGGASPVRLIVVAQALTVLGNPVLAGVMLWLALRPGRAGPTPAWMKASAALGFALVLALAAGTALRLTGVLS